MSPATWTRSLPWSIVLVFAGLAALGWAGIARCEVLDGTGGRFLYRQLLWTILAAAAMLAASLTSYRVLCRWAYAILFVALGLLVAVYFFPPINHAHRWIRLGPIGLQPSEFAKVAVVVALARYLRYRHSYRTLAGLLMPLGIVCVPVLLILREPDLGTSLVFLPVLLAMLYAAGARPRDLALVAFVGVMLSPLLWSQMSREQKSRVTALFAQAEPGERPNDDTYHLHQAKQMLALGGVWGSAVRGELTDDPAAYRLPEARSDFIFCVLGERLGWPGLALLMSLYVALAWRGLQIAVAAQDPFGRMLACGIVAMIGVQVLINMGMTVGLLPITGLPLPMVSYGGSGLVANGLMLGLLLNVGLRPGYEVAAEPFRYRRQPEGQRRRAA